MKDFPVQGDRLSLHGESDSILSFLRVKGWRRFAAIFIDILVLGCLCGFIFFNNLEQRSLGIPDESWEVQAAIEMAQGDKWWLPTHNGKPWLHKPPLKMWMTWPVLQTFASPNFAVRFLDACAGVITCLILYLFILRLFSSRLAGIASAISFLGCEIFIRYHGFRSANQDAALLLFSTIAMVSAWGMIESVLVLSSTRQKGRYSFFWALLGGLAIGAAILTKSAAGLTSVIIVSVFCLLSGKLVPIVAKKWKLILLSLAVASTVAGAYFVPVCMFEAGACGEFFVENIYGRILKGYHNVSGPWFYLERLFVERGAVPPELLALGLLLGSFQWFIRRDQRFGFVFAWAVVPVVCFSFSKIKLSWYIASSLCGMSLLTGLLVYYLWNQVRIGAFASSWRQRLGSFGFGALFLVSLALLGANLFGTIESVMAKERRIQFDLLVEEIRYWEHAKGRSARVVFFDTPQMSVREEPYARLLDPIRMKSADFQGLSKLVTNSEVDFIITVPRRVSDIVELKAPSLIQNVEPDRDRFGWVVILAYPEVENQGRRNLEPEHLPSFVRVSPKVDLGSRNERVVSGFRDPDRFPLDDSPIRWTIGSSSSFLIEGHELFEKTGAIARIRLAPHMGKSPGSVVLKILINGHLVHEFEPKRNRLERYEINIKPGVLHSGDNHVRLDFRLKSGRTIGDREQLLIVDSFGLKLP